MIASKKLLASKRSSVFALLHNHLGNSQFRILNLLIYIILFMSLFYLVHGDPVSPQSMTIEGSSTFNTSNVQNRQVNALAGNVTKINIVSVSQTQNWAGFYGNVSGTVTLDDNLNWTMYSWVSTEPTGVVYAVNQTISDWSTAYCLNISAEVNSSSNLSFNYDGNTKNTTTSRFFTIDEIESLYNISPGQGDGLNETFNYSNAHDGFFVGGSEVLANDCAAANTFQVDSPQSSNFQEVLLSVNNSEVVIFAAVIENRDPFNTTDKFGYNNQTWDFQMIVLENGKYGDTSVTPYYIYVELS